MKTSTSSLENAAQHVSRVQKITTAIQFTPYVLIPLAFIGFEYFEPRWKSDIFLILILALFVIGQLFTFGQFRKLKRGAERSLEVLKLLKLEWEKGSSLEAIKNTMENSAPACHVRDLVFRWIEQGRLGDDAGFNFLLDNAANRRQVSEERMLGVHVAINRTLLKLGFLGTLIGLLMTFPPMKEAILALKAVDGEMKFISDIANAIDGDQYAVLTTLVATGFSVLMEIVTIQVLIRLNMRFEVCNNYLEEWNVVEFRPKAREEFGQSSMHDKVLAMQLAIENDMLAVQAKMTESIQSMTDTMRNLQSQLFNLSDSQKVIGRTVDELSLYEKQYQSFIRSSRFDPLQSDK